MARAVFKVSFLIGASLLLTHCGRKSFSSEMTAASSANVATSSDESSSASDLLAGDACVATVEWYDGFHWLPYVSDADCIRKMNALIRAQSQGMLDFEIRHLTRAELVEFSATASDAADFVRRFEARVVPIYAFRDGWLNE